MFESAELGHKIDKATYRKEEPKLRADLLDVQYDLGRRRAFRGDPHQRSRWRRQGRDGNLLNAWMDRAISRPMPFPPLEEEERERPPMWRFWRAPAAQGGQDRHLLSATVYRSHRRQGARARRGARTWTSRWTTSCAWKRCSPTKGRWSSNTGSTCRKRPAWRNWKRTPRRAGVTGHDWDLVCPVRQIRQDRWPRAAADQFRQCAVDRRRRTDKTIVRSRSDGICSGSRSQPPQTEGRQATCVTAAPLTRALDGRDLINAPDLTQKAKAKYEEQLEKLQGRLNILSRSPNFPASAQ